MSKCVTHHYACACREAEFERVAAQNSLMASALTDIVQTLRKWTYLSREDMVVACVAIDCAERALKSLKTLPPSPYTPDFGLPRPDPGPSAPAKKGGT